MSRVYLDCETIPGGDYPTTEWMINNHPKNMKIQKTINDWAQKDSNKESVYRNRSLDPLWCQVIALSAAYDDEQAIISSGNDEEKIFKEFDNWIARLAEKPKTTKDLIRSSPETWTIVGFNIAEFDLPIIYLRAQKYKCKNIQKLLRDLSPFDKRVADVMRMALPTVKSAYVSMDNLCRFFGIEGKGDMDGSMVYDYFLEGRIGEVAQYCIKDCETTRELYKLLT